ncbi:MAG TPA: YwiC-like family protein [Anaeromyxobacter sp.]|nr:YwiC-like family protein [Anaeromyxobacter sp.]
MAEARSAPARRRLLIPHEHGAWGQLLLPLACALILGRLAPAALLLAGAVVLAFVAHEPLLVLAGQRGARLRAEEGTRARRVLLLSGGAAAVAGVGGLWLAPEAARLAALLPAALSAVVWLLARRRREKTLGGEVVVAADLASASAAVALSGGAEPRAALSALAAWVLSFAAATLAVHSVLRRARSRGAVEPDLLNAAGVVGCGVLAVGLHASGLALVLPLGVVPPLLVSLAICLGRIPARRLREVGFILLGASAATLVVLLAGLM